MTDEMKNRWILLPSLETVTERFPSFFLFYFIFGGGVVAEGVRACEGVGGN